MRVAIVSAPYLPVPPKLYGGAEVVINYLIRGLMEAGHTPVLFAPGDSEVQCELIPTVARSIKFPLHKRDVAASDEKAASIEKRTHRLLEKHKSSIDFIHSHGFDLKGFQSVPSLTTLHNQITLENTSYYKERKDLNFVAISKNQKRAFPGLRYAGVIYNGEDPAEFPLVTEPQDYLCFLGRFDEDKSPHLAIRLAIQLNMKIKLAGKIDYKGEYYFKQEIKPLLRNPNVEYLGELGFEDKVQLLSNAKCNLHPTNFREPFGLTVLEAAYCGTPTLAIRAGAMGEVIENGKTGVLVEDFVEGYHKIQKTFAMDRRYIAKRARKLFNYKQMTRQYIRAYKAVSKQYKPD